MYLKLKNQIEKLLIWNSLFKIGIVLFILFAFLTCAKIIVQGQLKEVFSYPDEDYKNLEEEATRMTQTHSFDTDYLLSITSYDNQSNNLSMDLSVNSSTLKITIDNYGKYDQEVSIKRNIKNQTEWIFHEIGNFVILDFLFSFLLVIVIILLANLIHFIAFLLEKGCMLIKKYLNQSDLFK